jgi:hypothetical protein
LDQTGQEERKRTDRILDRQVALGCGGCRADVGKLKEKREREREKSAARAPQPHGEGGEEGLTCVLLFWTEKESDGR